jgi:exodeoxyribonuclease VII large subunit
VARGSLSLKVSSIKKVGIGVLMAEIEARRAKIIAEGLADPDKKQKLPFLPGVIGLITASGSDAEKDVKQNVLLRWPEAKFRMINVSVQGPECAPTVTAAIKELDADPEVEVIIITRGGGGFLDLVGFSDETLVRTAAAAKTPIISAIGHENDNPILDNVADLRASTPTDAAKRVVPDVVDERRKISDSLTRMKSIIGTFVTSQIALVQQIRQHPLLKDPHTYLDQRGDDLVRAISDLRDDIDSKLDKQSNDLTAKRNLLRSLSPQSTLDRGYSVIRDSKGNVITDSAQVKAGEALKLKVAKGDLNATAN